MNQLPIEGFLRLPDVLTIIPVSKSTFWAGVKSGRYPKPVKIGMRCTAWRAVDIREFVQQTVSQTDERRHSPELTRLAP
jgi:prophage regulatory protein